MLQNFYLSLQGKSSFQTSLAERCGHCFFFFFLFDSQDPLCLTVFFPSPALRCLIQVAMEKNWRGEKSENKRKANGHPAAISADCSLVCQLVGKKRKEGGVSRDLCRWGMCVCVYVRETK